MARTDTLGHFLTDVADAIREKSGTSETIQASSFDTAIANIPSGSGELEEKDVNFYDYDGTLLYSYTIEEAQTLNELPAGPTHEDLVFDGWNWTLEDIKTENNKVDVGALYNTPDGSTKVYINLTEKRQLNAYVKFAINGTTPYAVTIDWGDGSPIENLTSSTKNHTYSNLGNYIITIKPDNNTIYMRQMGLSYQGTQLFYDPSNYQLGNAAIKKIYIGDKFEIDVSCFEGASGMEYITFPRNTSINNTTSTFKSCHSLKFIVLPPTFTTLLASFCQDCINLKGICLPKECTTLGGNVFSKTYTLKKIVIPHLTNVSGLSHFSYSGIKKIYLYTPNGATTLPGFDNSQLEEINIPNGFTTLLDSCFSTCRYLESINFNSDITIIPTNCFKNVERLLTISLPNSVTEIKDYAFDTTKIKEINLGNSLETIGYYALRQNYYLKKIKFPVTLTNIYNNAFYNTNAGSYDFSDCTQIPTLASTNAFSGIKNDSKIIVPDELYDDWIVATNWSTYASKIIKASEV